MLYELESGLAVQWANKLLKRIELQVCEETIREVTNLEVSLDAAGVERGGRVESCFSCQGLID